MLKPSVAGARFVLVVCSEAYFRRANGSEAPGKGLGAIWESQIITQEIYESQGKNEKFIPVIMTEDDAEFIPRFLRPYTHFNISDEEQYIRLLRLLTDQPEFKPPPLGPRIELPPSSASRPTKEKPQALTVSDSGNLTMLNLEQGEFVWFETEKLEEEGATISAILVLDGDRAVDEARKLRPRQRVGIAYGNTAVLTEVLESRIEHGDKKRLFAKFAVAQTDYGQFSAGSVNGIPADQIATLRARRILLDEKLPSSGGKGWTDQLSDDTLEVFVRGINTPMKIIRSPIPRMFDTALILGNELEFLTVSRLMAILFLRLSGVIEIVEMLSLTLQGSVLLVNFTGIRPRQYVNSNPGRIGFAGKVDLAVAKRRQLEEKAE